MKSVWKILPDSPARREMFIFRSTVDNLETPYSLQKFCVTNKDIYLPLKQMCLPTAVKARGTKTISPEKFADYF